VRGFVAVLRREVADRRLLAVVALGLGVAAVVLPRVPGVAPSGFSADDLRGGLAFGLALLLSALLALALGSSIIAGDLAERRLGFYFARPLAGAAIWGGKVAAGLLLVFGAGALALAPALLAGVSLRLNGIWDLGEMMDLSGTGMLLAWGVGLLFLFFGAHAASLVMRSRSSWAVLDLAALGTVAGLVWAMVRRLTLAGIGVEASLEGHGFRPNILIWMEMAFLAVVLLALLAASAVQVMQGRTDLRRGHRFLSTTLWGLAGAAALLFVGVTFWVLAAGPGDLRGVDQVIAAPAGHWIAFSGPAAWRPGYEPGFLYDVRSGRSVRAPFGSAVIFSADGKRAVWTEADGPPGRSPAVVFRLDLDRPGAVPVRTAVSFPHEPSSLGLSADGSRLAAYDNRVSQGRITVDDLDSGRLLAALPFSGFNPRLELVGDDLLRVYEIPYFQWFGNRKISFQWMGERGISELDLRSPSPRLELTGHIPGDKAISGWRISAAGDRALLRTRERLQLCDARTGEPLAELASGRAQGTFLADGRIAVIAVVQPASARPGAAQPAVELRIFSADGRTEQRRLRFGGVRNLDVVDLDQPVPGQLRVAGLRTGTARPSWELWLVDLDTGAARPLGRRRLAWLKPAIFTDAGVSFENRDGVIWYDPWSAEGRIVLKDS
jgi:hypothetical protein